QLARDERRSRIALPFLRRHRSHGPRGALEIGENRLRLLLGRDANGVAALLDQLRIEFGRLRPTEPREQVPVLFWNELFDFPLAVGDELQRDRLHAPGAQPAADLVPEQRADLVADEPVE